jgi:hypothetical protein
MGYITLTGAETDCSILALAAKVGSGPKATLATLYPRVLPVLFSGTAQAGGAASITLATSAPAIANLLVGCIVRTTGGTGGGGTGGANNQARVITAYSSGRVATVSPNWETNPDSTTTYEVLLTEMSLLRYADVRAWNGTAPNNLVSGRVDASAGALAAGVITSAAFTAGAIDAAAIAADAIGAAELATDAVNEIRDAVWAKTLTELTAVPGVTAAVLDALNWCFTLARNRIEQTSTTQTVRRDDNATALASSTHSDDGTTHIRGKFA